MTGEADLKAAREEWTAEQERDSNVSLHGNKTRKQRSGVKDWPSNSGITSVNIV